MEGDVAGQIWELASNHRVRESPRKRFGVVAALAFTIKATFILLKGAVATTLLLFVLILIIPDDISHQMVKLFS